MTSINTYNNKGEYDMEHYYWSSENECNTKVEGAPIIKPVTTDIIIDINVIVPDKVVEIMFSDGKKEKMICHKDDTFDLRRCCFIAISKHLYKDEYTYDGIEFMAERLMYLKKYVKIVNDALKVYKANEEEKRKKIREKEEQQIIRERQRLKRYKQKERRAQKHREVLIDILADSINEAKRRRK